MEDDFDTGLIEDDVQPEPDDQDTPPTPEDDSTEKDIPEDADETPEEDTLESTAKDPVGYVPEKRYKDLQAEFTRTSQKLRSMEKSLEKKSDNKDEPENTAFDYAKFERMRAEDPGKAMEYYRSSIKQETLAAIESKAMQEKQTQAFNTRAEKALGSVKDDAKRSEIIAKMQSVYEVEEKDGFTPSPEAAFILATAGSWDRAIELINKGLQPEEPPKGGGKKPQTPPPSGAGIPPKTQSTSSPQFRSMREFLN